MNKLITAMKKIHLRRILVTCMAGILLFVSTACSSAVQAKSPDGVVTGRRQDVPAGKLAVPGQKNPRPEVPGGTATSPDRGVVNRFEGRPTMNEFSDVDPRARDLEKAANRKANALIENAERNVIDQTSDVGENTKRILGKKGENAEDFGKNLSRNAETVQDKLKATAEDLVRGTQRGTENIKENTSDALRGADRNVSRAAEDVKDTARDLGKSAQRKAEDTADYAQLKASEAARNTQKGLNRAGEDIKDALD
jgi:ABC-type transporter Mla subunit MlaD